MCVKLAKNVHFIMLYVLYSVPIVYLTDSILLVGATKYTLTLWHFQEISIWRVAC